MLKFLQGQGYSIVRIKGSHFAMQKDQSRTTVPVHGNKLLKIGTLLGILRDIGLTPTQLAKLWNGR